MRLGKHPRIRTAEFSVRLEPRAAAEIIGNFVKAHKGRILAYDGSQMTARLGSRVALVFATYGTKVGRNSLAHYLRARLRQVDDATLVIEIELISDQGWHHRVGVLSAYHQLFKARLAELSSDLEGYLSH